MNLLNWGDGELLSSVRSKIMTMFTDINREGNNIAASAPASPVAGQVWTDTVGGVVYRRNTTNNAWIPQGRINGTDVVVRTYAYVCVVADFGKHLVFEGSSELTALTLPATGTVTDGWYIELTNASDTYPLLVDANGTQLIDGVLQFHLPKRGSCKIVKFGSTWYTVGRPIPDSAKMGVCQVSVPQVLAATLQTQTKYNMSLVSGETTLPDSTISTGGFVVPKSGTYDIYMYGHPVIRNAGGIYGVVYYDIYTSTGTWVAKAEGNFPVNGDIGIPCETSASGVILTAGTRLDFKFSGYAGSTGSVDAHTMKIKFIYRGA